MAVNNWKININVKFILITINLNFLNTVAQKY